ncbi:MAG: acetyltransferase [Gammaproteobacteria bacterium]|nr:acetyltransferase [Gammaproteobacteria bacterium]
MTRIDAFNGDADGICALQQIRLAEPGESVLVTGVKRDIGLLERVEAGPGDEVTVLDVSLDRNRDALLRVLGAGARVRYFDHHFAGDLPEHPALVLRIDPSPERGTSLLVDEYLGGAHRAWAVVGTFGDNLDQSARRAAEPLGLAHDALARLQELGVLLNYNAYGERVEDLHVAPDALFRQLHPYPDPLAFATDEPLFLRLREGYADDRARAFDLRPEVERERVALYVLPAEAWARRVSGVFANELAQAAPGRAHALLTRRSEGEGFVVSVRAPVASPSGADALCRQFPTGGGRRGAAGINLLPADRYEEFVRRFLDAFG